MTDYVINPMAAFAALRDDVDRALQAAKNRSDIWDDNLRCTNVDIVVSVLGRPQDGHFIRVVIEPASPFADGLRYLVRKFLKERGWDTSQMRLEYEPDGDR